MSFPNIIKEIFPEEKDDIRKDFSEDRIIVWVQWLCHFGSSEEKRIGKI